MANQEHLDILKQGVEVWNKWRTEHPDLTPDLRNARLGSADLSGSNLTQALLMGANLREANLSRADLSGAMLIAANLREANLSRADLSGANLTQAFLIEAHLSGAKLNQAYLIGADFSGANLSEAFLHAAVLKGAYLRETDLSGAVLSEALLMDADFYKSNLYKTDLRGAYLGGADLREADLNGADLSGADLRRATFVETKLNNAILTSCLVYGIAVWDVQLEGAVQLNLVITNTDQPTITVDNLKVAQFIYLLLNYRDIRDIINTITSKVVLILGRFTSEHKAVLDTIRNELRKYNYLPLLFDFEKPASRDMTETVSILAHLARFIIVDLTDPSSTPHEVATIIPQCIVPVQPLLLRDDAQPRHEYVMFQDLRTRYHWVLPTHQYQDTASLLVSLKERVIEPAEQKAQELAKR